MVPEPLTCQSYESPPGSDENQVPKWFAVIVSGPPSSQDGRGATPLQGAYPGTDPSTEKAAHPRLAAFTVYSRMGSGPQSAIRATPSTGRGMMRNWSGEYAVR